MIHMLLGSVLLAALAGCSTTRDLPSGYALDTQDSQGLAIVSLTLSDPPLANVSSFEYRVRPVGTATEVVTRPRFGSALEHARWVASGGSWRAAPRNATVVVMGPNLKETLDVIESGEAVGRTAVLRLPAGSYEINTWKLVQPGPDGAQELSPRQDMAYRFEVPVGRASYLGRLDLRITDQGRYQFAADGHTGRDVALVAQKLPFLGAENIVHQPGELLR